MTLISTFERVFLRACSPAQTRSSSPDMPPRPHGSKSRTDKTGDDTDDTPFEPSPSNLCVSCEKFSFHAMLQQETPEEDMGPLSDYLNGCPFCKIISQGVSRHWGASWNSSKLCAEALDQPPTLFIQSRSPVSVKEHGHVEYPYPRLLLALDIEPPGFSENRKIIREIDRVKNRHIIAEIEALPSGDHPPDPNYTTPVRRRQVGRDIDCGRVGGWLHECKKHNHSLKANESKEKLATDSFFSSRCGFRLIDVEDECLVLKTEPCSFAALSYVWGRLPTVLQPCKDDPVPPVLLTTMASLDALSAPGALSTESLDRKRDFRLPQTVVDAIVFSRKIGMRYLWVDTLCIVQDDIKDKSFLIQAMDNIYDIAAVTYIAASGKNADSGLRGVSPRDGRPIETVTLLEDNIADTLSLCPPSLNEEVRSSKWNTRGWTFQEQVLSQRCLYFTDEEVFFNCIDSQRREAYDVEKAEEERPDLTLRTGAPWWNRKLRKDPDPAPYRYLGDMTGTLTIQDYQEAVQNYSRRTLSFPEDVLNAFEGVFNRFSKLTAGNELSLEQTQGIPVHHIHRALLWFPSNRARKRLCEASPKVQFATWSWASWDGPIEFVFADSMWISRIISQAPLKKIQIHVLIPVWYYGGTAKRYYSQEIWKAACESPPNVKPNIKEACSLSKWYAKEKIGLDMDALIEQLRDEESSLLQVGQLGFWAAYIDAADVRLEAKSGFVSEFTIGPHAGEFRSDNEFPPVHKYVAVLTSDTITKPPKTYSVFLGISVKDGVSTRVGVGWVFYSETEGAAPPPWKHKFFILA